MKVELEEFRTEATHLKNQQATIRRLEERNRQLEQQVSNTYGILFFLYIYILFSFISLREFLSVYQFLFSRGVLENVTVKSKDQENQKTKIRFRKI